MENSIKVLKLITGEEVITKLKPTQTGRLILNNPMTVTMALPDDSGHSHITLTTWSLAGDSENVSLETKNVLAVLEPRTMLIDEYNSALSFESTQQSEQPSNIVTN